MHKKSFWQKIVPTRIFAFVIATAVCIVLLLLHFTSFISFLDTRVLDAHFSWKGWADNVGSVREGVTFRAANPNVHPDILIVGVDNNALSRFGRWPFPRRIHGDFVNNLARISEQSQREQSVFLDFFFSEPSANPTDDAMLARGIEQNSRVFLETVLTVDPPRPHDVDAVFNRHKVLTRKAGTMTQVAGEWKNMTSYQGMEPPMVPYATAVQGYGHANFVADRDNVFRRQPLVAKSSELLTTYLLDELYTDHIQVNENEFERLAWIDRSGEQHNIDWPKSSREVDALRNLLDEYAAPFYTEDDDTPTYRIRHFKDTFIPSITLSLALDYFHKDLSDAEVVIGSHITIPNPMVMDPESGQLQPYAILDRPARYNRKGERIRDAEYRILSEISIPIDDQGMMLINYAGPRSSASSQGIQTFPVRSYAGYAGRVIGPDPYDWPNTMALENKIVMVGAFATGIADDEKTTPYGLMYGVEMHANALNTILMNSFLVNTAWWQNALLAATVIFLVAFVCSRFSSIWSLLFSIFTIAVLFILSAFLFSRFNLVLAFSSPVIGVILTYLLVFVYRQMTEEKDKRRIKDMFGRYVSPHVVSQILEHPPELGGVDKELTVLFSDIRGFTTLSETMTPQELVNHLNLYLTAMTDIILEYKGTLDKYVGDEIMCFWGAPLPQAEHALFACRCAVKQMKALEQLNSQWPPEKQIAIGIGINSGIMTVGNMGSLGRMNYTLMGDNVNLAARLEGTNKEYQTGIIISEYTYGLVKDHVVVRELDNIRVKGKNKPVLIYELIDIDE